ncbi:Ig-like domain-containing protein, partial [Escherichia coli]|uniref:Ig-like domain-containing protein n=1 Tax=Escherichia coli TaxID=562 RepID=UPI003D064A8F
EAQAWLNSITFTSADVELGNTGASGKLDVTVRDSAGVSTSKSIDVTVTPSNDPVSVADATQNVPEIESGGSVITTVTLNAIDAEVTAGTQQPVQIVYGLTDLPQYGYLTLNGDRMGVGSIFTQQDLIDGKVKYVHTATGADQNAADGFTAVINDGATPKAQSDTVHVTLNITPQNQAPTLSGSGVVFEGQPNNAVNTGNVGQYIEADGGGDPGDTTLTLTITALPTHGTLWFNGVAVTVGQTFDYADRNLLTYANDGSENQGTDSFGVRVTDQGGGTGVPASTDGTITLTVRPVDDDPTLDNVTLHAQVDDLANAVTLTSAMIGASDVDSTDNHLSFIVDDSKLTHGYLTLDGYRLQNGGTFTMQDIVDGKVQYVQYASASASGDTDSFNFVVVDNTAALRWNADGTTYSRIGGVYTPGTETLTSFTFTIGLAVVTGGGPGTIPDRVTTITNRDSTWAGVDFTSGYARGEVEEGGILVLNGTSGDFSSVPGLSYTATGVDASQVVYTFLGFSNGATGGELQKNVGGSWVTLGEYATFTQADLDSGNIRFQHDGGETFVYAAAFSVSAGLTKLDANGNPVTDIWTPTLNIYVTPVNDLPVVTGPSSTVTAEGETAYLTTGQIAISDPDDANSSNGLEESATIKDGSASANNYAYNNDATDANALKFTIKTLPDGGTLQYYNGSQWVDVTVGQTLNASLLTASASTTGLRFVSDGSEVRSTTFTVSATDRWGATSASDATVKIQITNVNDAPQIAKDPTQADPTVTAGSPNLIGGTPVNNPLYVTEGSYGQITSAMLQAYDSDSSSMQVQYTITGAPTHGTLAYSKDGVNFSPIGKGSSFTQQDVANGYIYYLNDGTEGSGNSEPATPDDKFTFTISDGDKEQTGNAFWIYTRPTDDAPEVTAPSGIKNIASATATSNALPGFSVKDGDLTDGVTDGESDYLQVTVRLLHADGSAFVASEYSDVTLGYATGSGATISTAHGGQHDYLVLSGTRAQVNAALAGLTVTFRTDRNATYQVQTIADDRLRDASGTLTAGANGGTLNQPATPGRGAAATAVDATEYNWYSASVPEKSGNLSAASVTIRASEINDPGTLTVTNLDRTVYEDQASFIGGNIVVQDTESAAFGTPVTVTITAPSGTLGIGGADVNTSATASAAGSQPVTISGDNSGTLTLTGRASDIEALLNDAALGLTWQSGANVNHDLNGAAAGDVTITLHLDDGDSHIGDTVQADPADQTLNLTIVPVNDAPVVSATGGTVYLNSDPAVVDGTKVGGFVISDPDYTDGGNIADGETDFMQVTVRITDASGVPMTAAQYSNAGVSDITISSGNTTSGVTIDSVYNGSESALVIRGTLSQVNAYLAALTVAMTGSALSNADNAWRVEVIADDRLRDASGNLTSANSANGGQNDAVTGVAAVPTTAIDPYGALPSGLSQNVSTAWRSVFTSDVNDPATITVTDKSVNEGSTTVALPAITVADPDADSASLTVTVTLPGGFTFKTIGGTGGTVDAGGVNTTSFTLTGTLSQINSRLANLTVNLTTHAGTPVTIDVFANDKFSNGDKAITGKTNGAYGTVSISNGQVIYTPTSGYVGTDTFTYTVTSGGKTETATVTLTLVNDAPQVGLAKTGSTAEDTTLTNGENLLTGASDLNGDALTVKSFTVGNTTWAAGQTATLAGYGALTLNADGSYTFVPVADWNGNVPQVTYTITDGRTNGDVTSTLDISVTPVQDAFNDSQTGHGRDPLVIDVFNNDSFANSDKAITATTNGAHGTVTVSNGKVVYTLNDGYVGTDSFTYTVTSGGKTETANVTVTLTNGAPTGVVGKTASTAEDQTLTSTALQNLLNGASDPDGDTLKVSAFTVGATTWAAGQTATLAGYGALTINADGSYTFVPVADWNGSVPQVTYEVTDGRDNGVQTAALDITVTPVQDAHDDSRTAHAGAPVTVDVLTNDGFTNGDKAITGVTDGAHGTVSISNGQVVYTPTSGYVGNDSFTYTVTSGGIEETATVYLTLTNSAPTLPHWTAINGEDSPIGIPGLLLDTSSDADGDTLTVTDFTVNGTTWQAGETANLAGYGSLTITSDGSVTFIPVADWNGNVPVVTYTATDGRDNGSVTSTLTIQYNAIPDAVDDNATTHAGVAKVIDVLANDRFSNSDKAVTAVTQGNNGSVAIENGKVRYTPNAGFNGTDSFTYTVTSGGVTETATVNVTIANIAPVAHDDFTWTAEDTTLTRSAATGLLANDSDDDNDALAITQFSTGTQIYAAGQTATLAGMGDLTINADGSYTFVPVADWNGAVQPILYQVSDGNGGFSVATLLLTVNPIADAVNDSVSTHADVPVVIDALDNDSFSNSDQTITGVTAAAHGTVTIENNTLVYRPNAGYVGSDTFDYTVTSGGKTETATVTVDVTNVAPRLTSVPTISTPEDTTLNSTAAQNLLTNAHDDDGDALAVTEFTVGGTRYLAGDTATLAGYGDLTIRADGSFTFVPVADWNGVPPAATYTISDGKDGGVSTATLAFSVTPVADAKDDTASTHAGVAVTIDALHNDSFSNADKAIIDVDQGQHGSVTIENGQLVYRPVAGYVGQDTFTYTVESGGVRETANVTVTLTNSVPVATGETVASPEDYEARGDLLLNDRDADGDPLFIAGFTVGGQTYQPGDTARLPGVGELTIERNGGYRFTPVADWNGTAPVVTYTVSDGNDGGTTTATLAITVTPVADVKDDSATTHAGVPVTIDAIGNDRFVNPDQAITGVTQGAHGSVAIENGQLVYTPNAGYVGQDTFTYTVTSGGVTETAAVSVVMTNTVPVADGEIVTTPEDTAIGGELLTNDRDPDGDPLHIAGFTVGGQTAQPGDTVQLAGVGALTVNRDGSYRFTPVADWNGTAPVVTYTVSDGNDGGTATALLVITVTPVVDVKDDRATTHAGDPVTVDALGNDRFVNPDQAITGVTQGAHGSVAIENGQLVYTPNAGYVGQDTFTYTVTSGGVTETAQVTLEVTNTPPVAVADKASTLPETPVSGNLLTNDRDADSDPLHVAEITVGGATYAPGDIITIPGQGTLVVNRDGSYLFTPASGWSGFTPVLNYTLSDGNDGGTATGELRLLVNPVAEAWVKEAGLVDTASGAQTTTGAMAVLSLEPVESLTIGGQTLTLAQLQALSAQAPVDIATPDGVLSLTGFQVDGEGRATLQYRFTLTQAVNQPGESTTREEIRFSVNGQQTRAPGLLRVNILNDAPVAAADDNSIDQDRGQQAASGNVFSNDAIGADGAAAGGPVSAISSVNLNRAGAVGGVSLGEFGALTLDARGNYSYVLNRSNSRVASLDANATLSEVFTYTITDADGNTSQAQLTIVIHGVTPPQSVRTGDQHFPSYYTNYELSLDQPYSPGLFILPAIYGLYSDQFSRKVELNRKITELGRGMNDNGTPVLEDGILFTRWVNTTLQRSVVNTFAATGIGSQLLGDHFSHFSLNKSVQPAPVLENAPERPPLNERINERTTVQQERGEKTPDAKQVHAAAPGVVIVPQAAARPGAPSLAAQVDALARNRVAAPEPVTVGGATPHR